MYKNLKMMPLGGLGEFGMNAMVFQSGNTAVLVDAGTMFSDGRNPGLDVIVPDFSYLLKPDIDFKAIILTHGHEDHIGAVPYILLKKNVPVYGSAFTLELVKKKLEEFGLLNKAKLHLVKRGTKVTIEPFTFEWIEVAHSIPDAYSLAIDTPQGVVIHTGDFKIDDHSPDGKKTDLARMAEIQKEKGIFLLCADSTNVEIPGPSKSEKDLLEPIYNLMKGTKGWFVITTFSSHIPRITEVFRLAKECGKKVHAVGRSMRTNIDIARRLGYLSISDSLLIDEEEALRLPRNKVVLLVTGSQAEPRAALHKLALGEFKNLKLKEGDRVVFSSRAIPGHERSIYHLINHLYRTGAEVVTSAEARVHVSGHAYKEDLRKVLQTCKPKYLMPVHGEIKMLINHKKLGLEEGVPKDNILMMENGFRLEFVDGRAIFLEKLELSPKLVDAPYLVDLAAQYLKDRRKLSERGAMIVMCVFDRKNGEMLYEPIIQDFGFLVETEREPFINRLQGHLDKHLQNVDVLKQDFESIEEEIRQIINRTCRSEFDRRPVIFPYILTV
jgi:ribonuclease J